MATPFDNITKEQIKDCVMQTLKDYSEKLQEQLGVAQAKEVIENLVTGVPDMIKSKINELSSMMNGAANQVTGIAANIPTTVAQLTLADPMAAVASTSIAANAVGTISNLKGQAEQVKGTFDQIKQGMQELSMFGIPFGPVEAAIETSLTTLDTALATIPA